jgi:hypothetical protein
MFSKRGLSDIVATVLIVLLALAAVAIVWQFIRPAIVEGGTNIQKQNVCLGSSALPIKCEYQGTNYVLTNAIVKHSEGGDVKKIKAVLTLDDGTSVIADADSPTLLGTHNFATELNTLNTENKKPVGLEAAVVVDNGDGTLFTCSQLSSKILCVDTTSGSGSEASCGNGVIEGTEQCDGTNLNGQTCVMQNGQVGDLSCTDCQFDTSTCGDQCPALPPQGEGCVGYTQLYCNDDPCGLSLGCHWCGSNNQCLPSSQSCSGGGN